MKRDVSSNSDTSVSKRRTGAPMVIYTLADTTWRVAVPTVLFSGLGIVIDKWLDTMPLATLVGLVLGLIAAGKLVSDQVKAVEATEATK